MPRNRLAAPQRGALAEPVRACHPTRYTYRVAISNDRIESIADGQVTFRYKDYARGQRWRRMTLTADQFLRRFLRHVLPRGFVRIRSFGLLAHRRRAERLAHCRRLLGAAPPPRSFPPRVSGNTIRPRTKTPPVADTAAARCS